VRAQIVKSTQLRSDELTQKGINDNNKGGSAGFGAHGNQCPGCERLFHRGDHPSAIPAPCWMGSNAGVVDIGAVRGGANNPSGFVRIVGDLQAVDARTMQLLDAGIGLFEHDLGKCAGPLVIAILQFFVVYLLHRSVQINPQTKRG